MLPSPADVVGQDPDYELYNTNTGNRLYYRGFWAPENRSALLPPPGAVVPPPPPPPPDDDDDTDTDSEAVRILIGQKNPPCGAAGLAPRRYGGARARGARSGLTNTLGGDSGGVLEHVRRMVGI
eukprot:SAG25_NODE_9_length_28981_cov_95.245274_8_plen_124_part_00